MRLSVPLLVVAMFVVACGSPSGDSTPGPDTSSTLAAEPGDITTAIAGEAQIRAVNSGGEPYQVGPWAVMVVGARGATQVGGSDLVEYDVKLSVWSPEEGALAFGADVEISAKGGVRGHLFAVYRWL